MLRVVHLSLPLVFFLLLGLLACNNAHDITDGEALPQLSANEANTTTKRRNKAILNVSSEKLELNFNASRAVNTKCTKFYLPSSLSYKLALGHLPEGTYTFRVTCFDAEGKSFATGEQKVEISLTNPTSISIILQPVDSDIKAVFEKNYALWRKHKIESYSIVFQRSCFCIREVTLPARVEVEQSGDVQVTRATYIESGKPVPQEYLDSFLSIEETFELLAEAIEQKAESIKVSYDSKYGFPTELSIDYSINIADDELYIKISDFNEVCGLDGCNPPSCQPYGFESEKYQNYANTIELFTTKSIPPQISACLRSTHNDTCIDHIDIVQSRNANVITLRAIDNTPPNVGCGDALTPYARFIKVDTSDLKTGDYILRFLGTMRQEVSASFYYQAIPENSGCKPYSYNSKEYQNVVNTIDLVILESFPIQIDACLRSTDSNNCIEFIDITQFVDARTFTITLKAEERIPPDINCDTPLTPYARSVRVNTSGLKTGKYTLIFLGTINQKAIAMFDYQAALQAF